MASHRNYSSSSQSFHSGGRLQNGEEGNVFEGSGGERYRGTHSTTLPDARMDTRQASGAAQPDMCIETVLSLLRNSAQREQDDRARMQHRMERERADIAFLQHALERADRLENEKKLLDEENKQLRTEVERLKLEAAESHKKPASVRARGNHRASMNLNMSRTASPFASTTTTPTFMAPTNLFSGMSDRSSSVGGNSVHNVNLGGLERTITPYPEEETTSLDANQNERGTRIGQGTSSDGQTGDNAPGSATPSGSGASQQSGKMRQRLCKELSDMFNDDRSLYKLIHLGESTENREGNGFVGHVSIELRDHECNHQCGGSDPLLFQQCAEIIVILKLLDRINIDGQSLLSGAMPEYSPKRLLRHFVTVLMSAINRNRQQRGKAELTQSEQDELQEQLIAFICTTKFQGLADEYSNTIHFLASAPQQTFLMRCLILFSCAISNACRSKKISAELYNGNSRFPRYMSFGPTPSVQKRYPWVHQMLVSSSTEPQFAELKQLEEQLLAVLQATDRMNTNPISNVNELNNMLDEYVDMFYPLTVSQRPITNNSSSNSNSSNSGSSDESVAIADTDEIVVESVDESADGDADPHVATDASAATNANSNSNATTNATADSGDSESDLHNSVRGARASNKRGSNANNSQQPKNTPTDKRRKTAQSQAPTEPATAPATAQPRRSTRSRTKQSARTADEQSLN